jgi:hypothetical protein
VVDQLTLQTISIVLTGLTLSVAAIYYMLTLRYTRMNMKNTLETRQIQLFMTLYNRFDELEFQKLWNEIMGWQWEDFDDFWEKFGSETNLEDFSKITTVSNFFEGIGVILNRKLIEPNLVDDLMSGFILRFWEKIQPIALEYRKRYRWPSAWEWVEYLNNKIKPIFEEQHPELKT